MADKNATLTKKEEGNKNRVLLYKIKERKGKQRKQK